MVIQLMNVASEPAQPKIPAQFLQVSLVIVAALTQFTNTQNALSLVR